ncbi:MAG TPA: PAS domain-containing protein [Aggregatilineales bacterium]|nr:PAS domain-containing protein [Aggregatilineales bacterium]
MRSLFATLLHYIQIMSRGPRDVERLRRSEQRFRLAASLTSDALYEWTLGEKVIAWWGDIDGLLYYPKGTFSGNPDLWLNAIDERDRERVIAAREVLFKTRKNFQEEYRIRRADGSYSYLLDRAIVVGDSPKPRILGVITDLTNTYELTDALVESEVRYRTLFARAVDGIFVTDPDGHILDANPAIATLMGRSARQLTTSSFQEIIPSGQAVDFNHILEALKTRGEVGNFEMRFVRPDFSVVDVEVSGTTLGGGLYQFVARDVSARKQTQLLAAQRISELTALSELSAATIAGGTLNDVLNRALSAATNALEMPIARIYLSEEGQPSLKLLAVAGYNRADEIFEEILQPDAFVHGSLTPFSAQVRVQETELSRSLTSTPQSFVSIQVPLMINSRVIGLLVFSDNKPRSFLSTDVYLMDIMGRQLSIGIENAWLLDTLEGIVQERTVALFSTETRYKTLIDQVPGVVYTANRPCKGLTFISSRAETMLGVAPSEVARLSDGLLAYIKPEDLPRVAELAEVAAISGDDFDVEYRVVNVRTAHERWVHHHARLIVGAMGDTFWLGLLTDITRLKEVDELKGRFVATVSHELRTPVSVIKLRAATLSMYYQRLTDVQRLEMVQRIAYQSDILTELIEDVLRLARLDGGGLGGQIEEIDMTNCGSDVVEELKPGADNVGLTLLTKWCSEPCLVLAESSDLARIWRNLISNAIKYTSAPGTVTTSTGRILIGTDGSIQSSTVAREDLVIPEDIVPGAWVVGTVTDTGRGISDVDQVHVFTRFYRGDAALTNIPGTGLGLSLVKELLDGYGGHVALRSALGKGTSVAFWLPRTEEAQRET